MDKRKTQLTISLMQSCPRCGQHYSDEIGSCPNDGSPLDPPQQTTALNTELGDRYEIMSLVGSGGMSVVYHGRHKLINRPVAIKVMHARLLPDENNRRRFEQEAAAISRLNHRNLIGVHDFGITSEGQPFLVLEFVEGTSLANLLKNETRPSVKSIVNIVIQSCIGLQHAHDHGIIHRDIKPSNIMVLTAKDQTELVKIVDFGAAKMLPQSGIASQRLTNSGDVVGTTYYMSPEQCQGQAVDARSDIYSLGCVMYEALVGTPPLVGKNSLDTIQKQIYERPAVFRDVLPDHNVNRRLEAIIFRMLEKSPERRYRSMDELRLELEQFQIEAEKLHERLLAPADNIGRAGVKPIAIMAACSLLVVGALWSAWQLDGNSKTSVTAQDRAFRQCERDSIKALDQGNPRDAESSLLLALKQCETLGDTAQSLATARKLAEVYYIDGQYNEAQKIESNLAQDPKYKLTAKRAEQERIDSISRAATYCQTHSLQSRAEELYKLASKVAEQKFGMQSETYKARVLALASYYANTKQSEKLQRLFLQSPDARSSKLD